MSETIIRDVKARLVYNSRGEETIEVDVVVGRSLGRASAPAGKSKGGKEVFYYPEGGVEEAVKIVNNNLSKILKGVDASSIMNVEDVLRRYDGSMDCRNVGGNTIFAVSLATSLAASREIGIPLYKYLRIIDDFKLPLPLGNVIGGGKHAGRGAPDWQELLSLPLEAPNIKLAVKANFKVHETAGKLLDKYLGGFTLGKGDEGAYAPPVTTEKGLEILREAVDKVSDELGFKIGLGVDVAASSLWDPREKMYVYLTEGRKLTREQQMERVLEYVDRFNLCYVEDPLEEDDFDGFSELVKSLRGKTIVCGDDLVATNPSILKEAVKKKSITGLIIKPNQVGYLTRAMEAAEISLKENIVPVVSHRSGEPPEGYLAHLAVAWGGKILKAGIVGGERVAKINELLRIGEEIGFEEIARL